MLCDDLWWRLASEMAAINVFLYSHKSSHRAYSSGLNNAECFVVYTRYGRACTCWLFFQPIPFQVNCSELSGIFCWPAASTHRWNVLNLRNKRIRRSNRQERPEFLCKNNQHRSSDWRKRKTLLAVCATVFCWRSLVLFGQEVPLRSRAKYTRIKAFTEPKGSLHGE